MATEYGRSVYPEGFCSARRLVGLFHGITVIIADAGQVRKAVQVYGGFYVAADLEIIALVKGRRAARRRRHRREIAAGTAADDANPFRIDTELIGMGLQIADRGFHIFQGFRETGRRGYSVVKNNIVYILCKDILYTLCKHILYTLCKHIVYKFLLIEALIFLLNEDRCESDKPVSSGILAYLRQSSR